MHLASVDYTTNIVNVIERKVWGKEKSTRVETTSTSFTSKFSEYAKQEFPYVSEAELDPFNLERQNKS